jgi:hypothetical protein
MFYNVVPHIRLVCLRCKELRCYSITPVRIYMFLHDPTETFILLPAAGTLMFRILQTLIFIKYCHVSYPSNTIYKDAFTKPWFVNSTKIPTLS